MRILFISRCPPYPLHYGDRVLLNFIVRQLAKRGHQLDLLAFVGDDEDPTWLPHYRELFNQVALVPDPKPNPARRLARLLSNRLFAKQASQANSPAMWQQISEYLASAQYDLVHYFGGVQVYEYRALTAHLPSLIQPYDSYSLYMSRLVALQPTLRHKLEHWAARAYERAIFVGFDRVLLLGQADSDQLRALNKALPLRVIPTGIDADKFPPPASSQPSTALNLLFVGNYQYAPNADAAFWLAQSIFPLVRAAFARATLILVGFAPPPALQALATPDSGIVVTGRVDDVRPYYAACTLFICPLRVGAGMKNKLLEAMAMAKPIVATPLAAEGVLLPPGQQIGLASTAEGLAEAAIKLLGAPDLAGQLGAANRAQIEAHFTWEAIANQYEELYADLVDHFKRR
jgi:polysaccharide biosynthesis protein PslH